MNRDQSTDRARSHRPSPALVISIIALFVALGGTGYAINTIDSSDVVNNSLKSQDVKNKSLTGKDVKPNSLGGAQVKEASLAKVPSAGLADTAGSALTAGSADTAASASTAASANTANSANTATTAGDAGLLDGIDSLGFARVRSASSSTIAEGSPLTLTVPGYGSYSVLCDDNSTPATANDDSVSFLQQSQMNPALQSGLISAADGPLDDATTRVIAGTYTGGGGTEYTHAGDRIGVTFRSAVPGTDKAIVVEVNAFEDNTSATCNGQIQAFLFG